MTGDLGWPEADAEMNVYAYAWLAFVIWMAIDAIRRKAPLYWLAAIVLIIPFGSIVYFLLVKVRDYWPRPAPLEGERAPKPSSGWWRWPGGATDDAGELATADALEVAGRCADAIPLYEGVLARAPGNIEALHGLGRCMLGTGNPQRAVEVLGEVLSEDEAFRDFSAALEYAEALWQAGQHDDCLHVLEQMVAVTGRINHRVALAYYSLQAELLGRAREVLEQALAAHAKEPETTRRRQQHWADRAASMLASMPPVA